MNSTEITKSFQSLNWHIFTECEFQLTLLFIIILILILMIRILYIDREVYIEKILKMEKKYKK